MESIIKNAVQEFWLKRDGGKGVLGGKTLDGFVKIFGDIAINSGLSDVEIHTGKNTSQLPGYFRPHKSWDVVVTSNKKLVAAIELKSQVGSIGNNFNNRTEEVLGSGIDLHTAIEEQAFGEFSEIFTGYLILVEDSPNTRKNPKILMDFFPVMEGFLREEGERETSYQADKETGKYSKVEGISYLSRYDILCKRLMIKNLYSSAALVVANPDNSTEGDYDNISRQTSIETFIKKLENHCELLASYE